MLKRIRPSYNLMDEMREGECYKKKYGKCSLYLPINAWNIDYGEEDDLTYCQQLYIGMKISTVIDDILIRVEKYIIKRLDEYYKGKKLPFAPPIDFISNKYKQDLVNITKNIKSVEQIISFETVQIISSPEDDISELILTQQFLDMANSIRIKTIKVINSFNNNHERLINIELYERYLDLAYYMSSISRGKLPSRAGEDELFDGHHRNCVALHGNINYLIINELSINN